MSETSQSVLPAGRPLGSGLDRSRVYPARTFLDQAKDAALQLLFVELSKRGYDMDTRLTPAQRANKTAMFAAEQAARARYAALDEATKRALPHQLNAKYLRRPVLGVVTVYDALAELATIIDPLDPYLGAITQLTHQLQLAMAMEDDGVEERLVLCALVHDLGKLLIKFSDEDPMHVEAGGDKVPIDGEPGAGLFACTFRWDHGDFAYLRLRDHLEPDLAWLVRHHSIDIDRCAPYMDERDRRWCDQLLRPFARYDMMKDVYALPRKSLEDYRPLLERAFPDPILI